MTREEAKIVLGVSNAGEAQAAFRRLSGCHPEGSAPNAELWMQINEAKKVLLTPVKCPECKGKGRIVTRIARICDECKGSGWLS